MINAQSHIQRIHNRKNIIDVSINSQIKRYQQLLVLMSFSDKDMSTEYASTLEKINFLRKGALNGKLHH